MVRLAPNLAPALALALVLAPASNNADAQPDPASIARLIDDLRDDDVRYNAWAAFSKLSRRDDDAVRAALLEALDADDHQLRHYAAVTLMAHDHRYDPWDGRPPQRLADVAVEAIATDDIPYESRPGKPRRRHVIDNGARARMFLIRNARHYSPRLRVLAHTGSEDERFVAACALAAAGDPNDARIVVETLTPRLAHNNTRRDAARSCAAIAHVGRPALSHLRALPWTGDEQHDGLVRLLIDVIERPPTTPEQVEQVHLRQLSCTRTRDGRAGYESASLYTWHVPWIDGERVPSAAGPRLHPVW